MSDGGPLPFSVIVPAYARPERLARCLAALAALDYPPDRYEVVVADDGSPTPLEPVAAPFRGRMRVSVLRQANGGPASARNAAAARATGRFLAFTDDDCAPRPGWLRAFAAAFARPGGAAPLLGGRTENALADNVYAEASQQLVDYLYERFDAAGGGAPFFTSNNMAAPRDAFLRLGGFDETFPLAAAEDQELGGRWRERAGPLRYVPDAVVDHAHALSFGRFWRQHSNYGRGTRHLARVLARDGRRRHRLQAARFYLGLVRYPLTRGDRRAGAAAVAALLAVSQLATAAGYLRECAWRG